jgi:hypothetical protein
MSKQQNSKNKIVSGGKSIIKDGVKLYEELKQRIFTVNNREAFARTALDIFAFQFEYNEVYQTYCTALRRTPDKVQKLEDIPFLPASFFKSKEVEVSLSGKAGKEEAVVFFSSATASSIPSKHIVGDAAIYRESFRRAFSVFYGDIRDYCILALLPSYLERSGSSLVYMADDMIRLSGSADSGFYLHNHSGLHDKLVRLEEQGRKTLLLGVTYALLDFAAEHPKRLKHTIVMETGGMKGRRKELPRGEVHRILKEAFGLPSVHSEYGMTELVSQAYSGGNGIFRAPAWMRVLARDRYDPLKCGLVNESGGINIIDLANINSCSFIATDDAGIVRHDGSFEITGRLEYSDARGCNLMLEG